MYMGILPTNWGFWNTNTCWVNRVFCCTEIWVTQNSPKIRPISTLNINNFLIRPIWETNQTLQARKGSVLTKCDHSRLIWSSTLEDINKILFCTPFFGLKSKPKISGTDVKTTWNSVPGVLVGVILVHFHVLGHGKPSWWGGEKNFPPHHEGYEVLYVLT